MIAYLGPVGTFSQVAAKKYRELFNPNLNCEPCQTIDEVFQAVKNRKVKVGIVPIENSVEGSVTVTMDLLADKDFKLKIIQEIDLPIQLHLFALKNHKKIKHIISHPQPLAQSRKFLNKYYPAVMIEPMTSTAAAVQRILSDNLLDTAAVASESANQENLVILNKNIEDYPENRTRFIVLSNDPIKNVLKQKTSIVFSLGSKDKPGGLYEILGYFNKYKINLTKIESRPQKKMLGSYLFFIDFEGSTDDQNVRNLLKELGQITSFFKNLGSYPTLENGDKN